MDFSFLSQMPAIFQMLGEGVAMAALGLLLFLLLWYRGSKRRY